MYSCSNAFFSETTNMIKAELYMNVYWMVLYKLYVFFSYMKFKMAATTGLSLTLDPMGKMSSNFSQSEHIIGPCRHVEYPTGTKNKNFVEDHPRNIPAKFGSNSPSGFGEEA
jgi:hypothetical protein